MSIAALSSAGFSEFVSASSNIAASQQALQALQQSLASGNLSAAQTAFNTYQALTQNLANSNGSVSASNAQLAADLTTLGKAIASGDLSSSQAAFAAVQNDVKGNASPSVAAAEAAAAHTVAEIEQLLNTFAPSSAPATTDPLTQILDTAYGSGAGAASTSSTTDPTAALLEAQYGAGAAPINSSNSATGSGADTSGLSVYA
jgi:hypothetical protein